MQPGIEMHFYMMLSARTGAAHRLLCSFIGNCSDVTGHRSAFLYDAVCPDRCSPPAAFFLLVEIADLFYNIGIFTNLFV